VKAYRKKTFSDQYDEDSRALFEDVTFIDCNFRSCQLSMTLNPSLRTMVRRCSLVNCEAQGCGVETALFEDVLVENLKITSLLQVWGAAFRRVTFRGKIGPLMISHLISPMQATAEYQQLFDDANSVYYSQTDWAADISQAVFTDVDLSGIPGRLVRRDPETQVLVHRTNVIDRNLADIDLRGTHWAVNISRFLESGLPDVVLAAPKASRHFKVLLHGLQELRKHKIADED
jgi:hypothetical protein